MKPDLAYSRFPVLSLKAAARRFVAQEEWVSEILARQLTALRIGAYPSNLVLEKPLMAKLAKPHELAMASVARSLTAVQLPAVICRVEEEVVSRRPRHAPPITSSG